MGDSSRSNQSELRKKAQAFLGSSNDAKAAEARSAEDVISTPLPGETLAMFYARSRTFSALLSAPDFSTHGILY